MTKLANKTALVTGAARGLGQVFAERLAEDGCDIVLVDLINQDETRKLVEKHNRTCFCFTCDLSNLSNIDMLIKDVLRKVDRVDILVNNAAYQPLVNISDITPEVFSKIFAVNTHASFYLSQLLFPSMASNKWGRIINLASSSAWSPPKGFVSYITSKMANVGLTRALASELGDMGITVNAIAPGLTRTDAAARDIPSEAFEFVRMQQLIHRTGLPEDLAGVLSFLCSDDAKFITGQTYHVDGGAVL